MRIRSETAKARGLGGLWMNPDPTPSDIARMCKEIQATWPPEEFLERRSYQAGVSARKRMLMREREQRLREPAVWRGVKTKKKPAVSTVVA